MINVDEDQIPSIWRLQPAPKVAITPELVRARAARLGRRVRTEYRQNMLSLAGLVICCVFAAVVADGVVLRAGVLLVAAWASIGAYLIRLFGKPDRLPDEPFTCAAWYVRHLKYQRDYMLSAPWGMGLALPGLILMLIGFSTPPGIVPWQHSVAFGGVIFFVYFAFVIYGKLLAGSWQQEIESLQILVRGQGGQS